MNNIKTGLDIGHITTKAVLMREGELLGHSIIPTRFDIAEAAKKALKKVSENAQISLGSLTEIVSTGTFKDTIVGPQLNVTKTVPEYMAYAKGALFFNKNSRTIIDIGGSISKAVCYDQNGNLVDAIQNDKCADNLGIFFSHMARYFNVSEQHLSELALKSTKNLSIAIQCALSAELDAIDLMCQGMDIADVADAISKFIAERVADMSTYMSLTKEIVVAGGLAKSKSVVKHLQRLIEKDVSVLAYPEYVGAIGAAISYEGAK